MAVCVSALRRGGSGCGGRQPAALFAFACRLPETPRRPHGEREARVRRDSESVSEACGAECRRGGNVGRLSGAGESDQRRLGRRVRTRLLIPQHRRESEESVAHVQSK